MKILKRIVQTFLWLILIIILMYNTYCYISLNVLGKDVASVFGYAVLEVVSDSMVPSINKGDLIIVNTNDQNYREKRIVTFKDKDNMIVTHRIIEINDDKITTRGDANNADDPNHITKENIIGVYAFKISNLGYIIKAIKNPITLISILLMGFIVCTLISTDKDGIPLDISEEEKKFLISKKKKEAREKIRKKKAKKKQQQKKSLKKTTNKDSKNKEENKSKKTVKKTSNVGSKKKATDDSKKKTNSKTKKKEEDKNKKTVKKTSSVGSKKKATDDSKKKANSKTKKKEEDKNKKTVKKTSSVGSKKKATDDSKKKANSKTKKEIR